MSSWKGNIRNPAPDSVKEPIDRSEKVIGENRSLEVRRDKDTQRDFTIGLYDIDQTIISHIEQMQLQVEDAGKQIQVPVFFGAPEKWIAARRDGYIRDKQGKLILPAIVLKRTTSETDQNYQFFNRYLNTSAMRLYSSKNQYTKFSVQTNQTAPVHEVYNMVMPSPMTMTYHFIIWTEYVEQMNKLVERFRFETQDYWGSKKGLHFRTRVESYGHTVELQTNDDRIVKTEFDLIAHGYILPDSMTKLEKHEMTTKKMFTPRKIVMGLETVMCDGKVETRAPRVNPPLPPIQMSPCATTQFHLPPPLTSNDYGQEGWLSYDTDYYYIYTLGKWKRTPIILFNDAVDF